MPKVNERHPSSPAQSSSAPKKCLEPTYARTKKVNLVTRIWCNSSSRVDVRGKIFSTHYDSGRRIMPLNIFPPAARTLSAA